MTRDRLFYLDNLRAFAMLVGIFVHTTTLADFGRLEIFAEASDNFRMGVFFAISGFFAAMLLDRRPVTAFLFSRTKALLVPLAFGVLALNPLTLLLIYNRRIGSAGLGDLPRIVEMSVSPQLAVSGHFVWHLHLWFLISLFCYTLSAPLILRMIRWPTVVAVLDTLATKAPAWLAPLLVASIVVATVIVVKVLLSIAEPLINANWIVRATLSYFPYYVLGMMLYGQALWDRLHRVDPLLITVVLLLWLLPLTSGNIGRLVDIVRREFTVCASLFALLMIFRAGLSHPNRFFTQLSDSIYTVYILHYLCIYALALLLESFLISGSASQFWIISLVTAVITVSLHALFKRYLPALLFPLNGRTSSRVQ